MKKRSQIFILLLAALFTLVTIGISAADDDDDGGPQRTPTKQDVKFSKKKCENLGGKVTKEYNGSKYDGKVCLYAANRATLCNKKWKKCKYHSGVVALPRRRDTPPPSATPDPSAPSPPSAAQRWQENVGGTDLKFKGAMSGTTLPSQMAPTHNGNSKVPFNIDAGTMKFTGRKYHDTYYRWRDKSIMRDRENPPPSVNAPIGQ